MLKRRNAIFKKLIIQILINPLFHNNVQKWPNILLKSFGVNTARFLKYVWPFYNMKLGVNNDDNTIIVIFLIVLLLTV